MGVSHCVLEGSFWVREVRKVRRVRMMDFGGESSQLKILANFYIIFLRNFKYFFLFLQVKNLNTNQECRNSFFRP